VSPASAAAGQAGWAWHGADIEQAAGVVRRAIELGVTFVDTARNYGTEEAVGLGIRGRRDEVFLSTKSSAGRGERMFTAAELSESLDGSLRRLGTDHVDVFHLHGSHPAIPLLRRGSGPEMKRQQAAGKIRFVGATEQFGGDTAHKMLTRALPTTIST